MSSIILPQSLYALINDGQINNNLSDYKIQVIAGSIKELFNVFTKEYPQMVRKIFADDGALHKNVVFVLDEQILDKNHIDKVAFNENSILEIMFQFAGG
ncbi:MAG: hypothetical protein ACD_21C00246G0007 [uncultured bacterium]|nr:MAG: hypothetical protein ACD_21C00246G0007 [uncultured bacterium]